MAYFHKAESLPSYYLTPSVFCSIFVAALTVIVATWTGRHLVVAVDLYSNHYLEDVAEYSGEGEEMSSIVMGGASLWVEGCGEKFRRVENKGWYSTCLFLGRNGNAVNSKDSLSVHMSESKLYVLTKNTSVVGSHAHKSCEDEEEEKIGTESHRRCASIAREFGPRYLGSSGA